MNCPNCNEETVGLYSSETDVRHCGCYYWEPHGDETRPTHIMYVCGDFHAPLPEPRPEAEGRPNSGLRSNAWDVNPRPRKRART